MDISLSSVRKRLLNLCRYFLLKRGYAIISLSNAGKGEWTYVAIAVYSAVIIEISLSSVRKRLSNLCRYFLLKRSYAIISLSNAGKDEWTYVAGAIYNAAMAVILL